MELERFPSAQEDARATEDRPARSARAAAAPITERFGLMLRARAEELREISGKDPTPTASDVVRCYEEVLSELTVNSKPIITELTVIAEQQIRYADQIVDAICSRVLEVPVDQKLPSLYLIDSIVKNIGQQYVRSFAAHLPKVFCEAYNEVHPDQHPSMCRLFGTWSQVFPSSVLRKIEDGLQLSPSENKRPSELFMGTRPAKSVPAHPSHGILENPKYLGVNSQYEQSAMGTLHTRVSSTLQVYDQKPSTQYSQCDLDLPELLPQQLGIAGSGRPQTAMMHTSSMTGRGGLMPFSKKNISLPSSPPRMPLSPPNMRSQNGTSRKIVGRASPSHPGFENRPGRVSNPNVWLDRSQPSNQDPRNAKASITYDRKNGYGKQHPRELIDAYGNPRGRVSSYDKLPKVPRLNVNGTASESAARNWKNSEEEEYAWENMSPTLADQSTRNHLPPLGPSPGNYSTIAGISRSNPSVLELRSQRHRWPVQAQLRSSDDPSFIVRDGIHVLESHTPSMMRHLDGTCQSESLPHHQSSTQIPHSPLPDMLPPLHTSELLHLLPVSSNQKSINSPVNILEPNKPIANQGSHPPPLMPDQEYIISDRNKSDSVKFLHLPYQHPGCSHLNREQQIPLVIESPAIHGSIAPPALAQVSSYSAGRPTQPMKHLQRHRVNAASFLPSSSFASPSLAVYRTTDASLQLHNGPMPPLLPGPPPASSQMGHQSQNMLSSISASPAGAFSGLISSLVEQGFITMEQPAQPQDSLGTEFNMELLKERNESAINALYAALQRQCATCGLRFKSQEEHSSHMDWHVTKNRISRSHKQSSRKWFVTAKEWFSVAEILGNDVVPGVLSTESVMEKTEEKEMAVPADDDQNACALCGETFDDFYSDEKEEWMYKGAVYLNAPNGYIEGLDRSQLGPIVHAKCRPESNE